MFTERSVLNAALQIWTYGGWTFEFHDKLGQEKATLFCGRK
jgi:hypothetical protein